MARFVKHESCEKCGSRDNVGVYDDDSKYCFGCHWYTPPSTQGIVNNLLESRIVKDAKYGKGATVDLPHDFTPVIPPIAFNWLSQYGITKKECEEHMIGWSDIMQRLIFPVMESNRVIFWTGRYFGTQVSSPKYFSEGSRNDVMFVAGVAHRSRTLVVVEDIVSAIVVGRHVPTLCLFGSNMPFKHAERLSDRFMDVTLWLDPDMKKSALKQALDLSLWFFDTKVVFTKHDPKSYTSKEISEILNLQEVQQMKGFN